MNRLSIALVVTSCLCLLGCSDAQLTAPDTNGLKTQSSKKGGKPGGGDPTPANWAFAVADKQVSLLNTPADQDLPLTRGRLNRYEPTYTTDGHNVAYLKDVERNKIWKEVRIVGAGGDNDRLLYSFGPGSPLVPDPWLGMDWLPDSHKLLFGHGNVDLAVLDTTDSSWQRLGLSAVFCCSSISGASPGQDLDAAAGFQGPVAFSAFSVQYDWSIYVVMVEESATGGMTVDLPTMVRLDSSPLAGSLPVFSPDGTSIVFTDRSFFRGGEGLYVVGFDVTAWSFDAPLLVTLRQVHGPASWAPDGSWIVFHGATGPAHGGGTELDLYRVRPDVPGETIVTDGAIDGDMWPGSPDWNPLWCNEIDDPPGCGL